MKTPHLTSYANNTKWRELRWKMVMLGPKKAPYYRTKKLQHPNDYRSVGEPQWDGEWYYHFEFDNIYKYIEWCELKPSNTDGGAKLKEIVDICEEVGFEIEIEDGIVRLIGYR